MPRKQSKNRKKSKRHRRHKSKKSSRKRSKSSTKITWEKFLKNKDSKKALQNSWNADNPQKYYKSTIVKLARKYSNTR